MNAQALAQFLLPCDRVHGVAVHTPVDNHIAVRLEIQLCIRASNACKRSCKPEGFLKERHDSRSYIESRD